MPNPSVDHQVEEILWNARLQGTPCAPLTETFPELTVPDAYRVSRQILQRRTSAPGNRLIGRKIGLTSLAVQKQLAVSQPDFGYLTQDMLVPDGGCLPAQSLIQGRAEGEVAFLLKNSLQGPGLGLAEVAAAIDCAIPCIEIIDSRVRDWKIKIQDTIADNASSAFFVLGSSRRELDGLDLRMMGMTLRRNGELESTGVGAACLDHPLKAVAWLANALAEFEEHLHAGDIILSGAYGPVVPFLPGDQISVEFSGLGKASCSYLKPEIL